MKTLLFTGLLLVSVGAGYVLRGYVEMHNASRIYV